MARRYVAVAIVVLGSVNSFVYGFFPPKSGIIDTPPLSPENG